MDFNTYQRESRKTAKYHKEGVDPLLYPTLGLTGEAGEVADKIKKMLRDDDQKLSEERREALKLELGDVLWYVAQLSTELGYSLGDVAQANLEKLFSRLERNQIKGDGDNR